MILRASDGALFCIKKRGFFINENFYPYAAMYMFSLNKSAYIIATAVRKADIIIIFFKLLSEKEVHLIERVYQKFRK